MKELDAIEARAKAAKDIRWPRYDGDGDEEVFVNGAWLDSVDDALDKVATDVPRLCAALRVAERFFGTEWPEQPTMSPRRAIPSADFDKARDDMARALRGESP